MTPFDFWSAGIRTSQQMAENWVKMAELSTASHAVIGKRQDFMRSAVTSPLTADYAELGRMVPEKMMAFTQAGMAAFSDMVAFQADAWAQWRAVMATMMHGGVPSLAAMTAASTRSARMTNRAVSGTAKAIAPIHATATGNARRLSRSKRA